MKYTDEGKVMALHLRFKKTIKDTHVVYLTFDSIKEIK